MATARFYLRNTNDTIKDTLILLYFSYNNKRAIISTELAIQPRYWNGKEQKARSVRGQMENTDFINDRLREYQTAIEEAFRYFKKRDIDPDIEQLKEQYKIQLLPPEPIEKVATFWNEYEKFIESSKGRVVNDVIKDYRSLKKHLKAYEKHKRTKVSFDSFGFTFYQQFVNYLTYNAVKPDGEKGLATNTVGKQIKNLKVFLNHCFKHEIVERFDLSNFKTLSEEVDKIYLSVDEIQMIYDKDLSEYLELEESRDLFVLGCYLGLRFSDLIRLRPEMIEGEMVRIQMSKTGTTVVIPLHRISKEIINKYNGNFPKAVNSMKFNSDIKEIGKLAGIKNQVLTTHKRGIEKIDTVYRKYELITSHTCRRSFCTNQYLAEVPTVFLMKISGHRTERAFLRYIKIDEEMAAKKMLEIWGEINKAE